MGYDAERVIHKYENALAQTYASWQSEKISLELQLESAIAERNVALQSAADMRERLNRYESQAGGTQIASGGA